MSNEFRSTSNGKVTIVYMHPTQIALQREIHMHPKLMEQLAAQEDQSFEAQFATVCTYCGVEIDGYFSEQELERVAHMLIQRLQAMRTILLH